ncbi:hypothetical protein T4B_2838 [Trichinella pseudospiralis]|uniref:Uncharacterized protein n=1 Tax=Trichinella pseudospiralis TaxID=6337 RepID=A0A0V1H0Z4_TRIPS|nr:hypothetical protein T4B_5658 [Trichinella pseudospiralis]KRZ04468.1 hypothetical protein T4B_2838 [Trichinella pseudospiralis]KRZ35511.1 hypothetical protein T4C_5631 [Trichinella pseudospiralis]
MGPLLENIYIALRITCELGMMLENCINQYFSTRDPDSWHLTRPHFGNQSYKTWPQSTHSKLANLLHDLYKNLSNSTRLPGAPTARISALKATIANCLVIID